MAVPTPLRSYTQGRAEVEVDGDDLAAVLLALDREYPGFRFRVIDEQDQIRRHIKLFVGTRQARALSTPVPRGDPVHVLCALSGGSPGGPS